MSGAGEPAAEVRVFDAVGGQPFFDELVERFYKRVATDILLRPLYPDDLTDSKRHLALFLGQYWGGPTTYSEQRGHPRLRMRHAPFAVTFEARDRWLHHFRAALDEAGLTPEQDARFWAYVTHAANFMVNATD